MEPATVFTSAMLLPSTFTLLIAPATLSTLLLGVLRSIPRTLIAPKLLDTADTFVILAPTLCTSVLILATLLTAVDIAATLFTLAMLVATTSTEPIEAATAVILVNPAFAVCMSVKCAFKDTTEDILVPTATISEYAVVPSTPPIMASKD